MYSRRSHFGQHPNRLSRARSRALAEGPPLLDLTLSNPTDARLDVDPSLACLGDARGLRYEPDPRGLLSAREVLVERMAREGIQADVDRMLLTSSTSEAYAFLFKLLCDPHDEVLVPAPSYPMLDHLLQLEHVRQVSYPLRYDGEWHIDLPALRAKLTSRTRAIIVISPNNPTGSYLKREELAALAALGVPIVSDEVFAAYPLFADARRVRTALEAEGALVFSLFGLSKWIGLPQLKLAWLCAGGPQTLVEEAMRRLEMIADSFLSVGTPVQVALPALLAEGAATTVAIQRRISRNWQWLSEHLPERGTSIDLLRNEGGWYGVLRLPAILSAEDWALTLLEQDGVFVHPGYYYDFTDEAFLILSLLTPEPDLRRGMQRVIGRVHAIAGS